MKTPIRSQRLFLKKQNRILTPRDYQQVFKQGSRKRWGRFTFVYAKNSLPYARLGLAIAKRAIPLSVERNRVRRLFREGFRHFKHSLAGLDIVVVTGQGKHEQPPVITLSELNQQWRNLSYPSKKLC